MTESTPTPVPDDPPAPPVAVEPPPISQPIAQRRGVGVTRKPPGPVTYEYDKRVWVFHGAFFAIGFFVAWVLEPLLRR